MLGHWLDLKKKNVCHCIQTNLTKITLSPFLRTGRRSASECVAGDEGGLVYTHLKALLCSPAIGPQAGKTPASNVFFFAYGT